MKRSEYLYNDDPASWENLPYKLALKVKIRAAKDLLSDLLKESIKERDVYRIKEVEEAIKFNENLLDELL